MTSEGKVIESDPIELTPSTLPFDPTYLTQGIRVRPAQFARMCNVSKQAVSGWVREGKITLFPDGTLDPARAARQVIANSDPSRLRARIFKCVTEDVITLRRKIIDLEMELQKSGERCDYLESFNTELIRCSDLFMRLLIEREADIRAILDNHSFAGFLEALDDEVALIVGEEVAKDFSRIANLDSKSNGLITEAD